MVVCEHARRAARLPPANAWASRPRALRTDHSGAIGPRQGPYLNRQTILDPGERICFTLDSFTCPSANTMGVVP